MIFDEKFYLECHADVRAAVKKGEYPSGRGHYNLFGSKEGRLTHRVCAFKKPTVALYVLTKNEEFILPFFLQHYLSFVDKIIVYDNNSTDRTRDILSESPDVETRRFDTFGITDDKVLIDIKNTCYKEQRGKVDYVIVCDADEFLYAPSLRELLMTLFMFKSTGITVADTCGYEMFSRELPVRGTSITRQIKNGTRKDVYSKSVLFSPEIDINFSIGSHGCSPDGNVVSSEIKLSLLHYRMISLEYAVKKSRQNVFGKFNTDSNFGVSNTPFNTEFDYQDLASNNQLVIDGW